MEATFVGGRYIAPQSGIFKCPDLREMSDFWGVSYAFNAKVAKYLLNPPDENPELMARIAWSWCNTLSLPASSGWRSSCGGTDDKTHVEERPGLRNL